MSHYSSVNRASQQETVTKEIRLNKSHALRRNKILGPWIWEQVKLSKDEQLEKAKAKKQLRLAYAELANSPLVRFKAHRTNGNEAVSGKTAFLRGSLVLHSGREIPFSFTCVGALAEHTRADWAGGDITDSHDMVQDSSEEGVILPTSALQEEYVQEALIRWYMQRYSKEPNWAYREKKLPDFILDIDWEWGDDRANERVGQDDFLLRKLCGDGVGELTWSEFGRTTTVKQRGQRGF